MNIRRLGWAGVELTSADTTVVVDYIRSFGGVDALVRVTDRELPAASRPVDVALVTHLHEDHTDPAAIGEALAGPGRVIRPRAVPAEGDAAVATAGAERGLAERELRVTSIDTWETSTVGPFALTALPAVDGFGDPQVSWLVEADGQCVFHAGDTMFHGSWWNIALRVPRIDVAFLPINGAVCQFPHRRPASPFPAVMTPEQAAHAAHILGAARAVPMHYDTVHLPPFYVQVDEPVAAFQAAAAELRLPVTVLAAGAWLERGAVPRVDA